MKRPQHSEQTKARAIALAVEHGPAEAQRRLAAEGTEINPATIRSWCSRAGVATVAAERMAAASEQHRLAWEERRTGMVHEMGATADKALLRATEALDAGKGRDAKEYALTLAILIDKAQLLSGGSTARFGTDADRAAVVSEARERALRLVRSA
jgi:transposase-like protein